MKIYISGAMSNQPYYGFPTFDATRDFLDSLGHDPVSPADIDRSLGVFEDTPCDAEMRNMLLRHDLAAETTCEAIAFLPGWELAEGAWIERNLAEQLGLSLWRVDPVGRTLVRERVVGISGYVGAGKDAAASHLVQAGFTRIAYADALKEVAYAANPVVGGIFRKRRLQELVDKVGWDVAKQRREVRRFLQHLGSEGGRAVLGGQIWVDTLFRRSTAADLVIPDARYANEMSAIRRRRGLIVRIERPGVGPVNGHSSETEVSGEPFEAVVHNDGTLVELGSRVLDAVNRHFADDEEQVAA